MSALGVRSQGVTCLTQACSPHWRHALSIRAGGGSSVVPAPLLHGNPREPGGGCHSQHTAPTGSQT